MALNGLRVVSAVLFGYKDFLCWITINIPSRIKRSDSKVMRAVLGLNLCLKAQTIR